MNLAIIKYNAGNIQSVLTALERLGVHAEVTDDAEKIKTADKVIFPGVGEAGSAMRSLQQNNLHHIIKELKQPVLGICVGMQLLCEHSEEGDTKCLGIVPVKVRKFQSGNLNKEASHAGTSTSLSVKPVDVPLSFSNGEGGPLRSGPDEAGGETTVAKLKVPQVGWNTIYHLKSDLFKDIQEHCYIYNVHSYFAADSHYTIAKCHYGLEYAAAVRKNNFYGVQFHTEKSADIGDRIIQNFLDL